jgi:hypothetical protein
MSSDPRLWFAVASQGVTARIVALGCIIASSFFLWGAAECTNSDPAALNDFAANFGQLTYVDVLANDSDPDGERLELTVTGGTCSAVGTVSVESDLIRFQPIPVGVSSTCTVTYRATDESGNFDGATLTLEEADLSLIFADGFEAGTTGTWSSCAACLN